LGLRVARFRVALHPIIAQDDLLAPIVLHALEQAAVGHALEPGVLEQRAQEEEPDQQQEHVDEWRPETRTRPRLLVELLAARIRLSDRHRAGPLPQKVQVPPGTLTLAGRIGSLRQCGKSSSLASVCSSA